jgi:hypothetical protein
MVKVKVKRTLVQALRLCAGRTAHRWSRSIALPFHDHGTRRGEGLASRPGRSFTPGKDPVPIAQETVWAPGPVWTSAENLVPTGIRSPDRPTRSQSLYRLCYPAYKKYGALLKWNRQGKSELFRVKSVPVTVRPIQVSHKLVWDGTRDCTVQDCWLTTSDVVQLPISKSLLVLLSYKQAYFKKYSVTTWKCTCLGLLVLRCQYFKECLIFHVSHSLCLHLLNK